jgi:hypothetical protein
VRSGRLLATSIDVLKRSYGYTVRIECDGRRPFYAVVGPHPADAAYVVLSTWQTYRDNGGASVNLPPEVEALIRARGPLPWA